VTGRFIVRWSPHEAQAPPRRDVARRISQTAEATAMAAAIPCWIHIAALT
jgi:hypothetical protein